MFGYKKYPTPILRPLWPFFAGGAIVVFGVNSIADAMMKSDQYKDDPRNPYLKRAQKEA
ncbi:ATPase, F0 complex, subunit J, partial [Saitoella complicata NRRL Y-17804]|uniref:ATPase, F0 complex, subunit J n=1 Tax=Saitoella complicata (strain BCRC 22490 / CBS 7301 / JCM 7358 / NBRC 10748 / NRRL Y-17804) TaxID=698492 RepID=UPI0008670AB1